MFLTEKNLIVFDELDSTNNYAKQMLAKKAVNGTVVLAHFQKSGKGQQGNYWESERGKNLTFSLILQPDFIDAGKQFCISKMVSVALVNYLEKEVGNVKIKWPNDIYVGEKKIAGILIENTIKGSHIDSSIIGIGLNVNQKIFTSDAPNPVSLKQLNGNCYNIERVLSKVLEEIEKEFLQLQNSRENSLNENYFNRLFRCKQWSFFRREGKEFEARIVGIGDFGQLQLEDKLGQVTEFMFKEVEFVV